MSETWSHWFVGADNTGDITTWDNLLAFRESVKKDLEEVHLVRSYGKGSSGAWYNVTMSACCYAMLLQ